MNNQTSAIKRIEQASRLIEGSISLAQGTSSFSSHEIIKKEVISAIENNKIDRYSDVAGLFELRQIISQKLSDSGFSYSSENEIVVTSGAVQALSAIVLSLFKRGDQIITFTPTYPYYSRIIEMAGVSVLPIKLQAEKEWAVPIELLEKSITPKTKGIIICNPNNPTGSVIPKKDLLAIARLAEKHSLKIILDDAYHRLYYGKQPLFNLCDKKFFNGEVIRIVSLSKTFDLSGWRIAFLHGPQNLIRDILEVHDNLVNCAPVVSQYAAIAALKNEKTIFSENLFYYSKRRKLMASCLKQMKDYFEFDLPQGTYFFFPKIKNIENSRELCFQMLENSKVAVVPGEEFGPGGEGRIRICFGKSEEEIIEGMSRIKTFFSEKKELAIKPGFKTLKSSPYYG